MSSIESAPAALPHIYNKLSPEAGLEGPATLLERASEGDRFGSKVDGLVFNEAGEIDITDNRMPETGVDGGLYKAEAVDSVEGDETINGVRTSKIRAIKQFLFRRSAAYNDRNDMRPTRLVLTQDKLDMNGTCNPNNPYNPLFKKWVNRPDGTFSATCTGNKYAQRYNPPLDNIYIKVVDNLGGKLARHAGVADGQRGKPTSIVATNRYTKLKFDNSGGPVDSILFRNQGKPIIYK
jgi:hypothetical protein